MADRLRYSTAEKKLKVPQLIINECDIGANLTRKQTYCPAANMHQQEQNTSPINLTMR
jgi:hypothetical protein